MESKLEAAEKASIEMAEKDYYFNSYTHFGIHEEMLKDTVRTDSYRKAICAPDIVKDKVVLDVGCGTGILCLFAARAGAKHVYGIDCAGIIEQAREIVKLNEYEDKITLIRGKVEDVDLPEKVDVLVSEWMGYFLMFESMLETVIYARDKWLKPGGLVLPDKCTLYINAIEDAEYKSSKIAWWENVYGFDMSCIEKLAIAEPLVDTVPPHAVVTNNCAIKRYDITTATLADMAFDKVPFTLRAHRDDNVHALVTYFDVEFTHSKVRFSTGPHAKYTHWRQAVIYLHDVLNVCKGEVITGTLSCKPNAKNPRDIDIELSYKFNGSKHKSSDTHFYCMK